MSYAIGTVFYGIPLTEDIKKAVAEHEDCDEYDLDPSFFEDDFMMLYTQGDGLAGFCGVQIATFSETEDVQLAEDFVKPLTTVTPEQRAKALERLEKLPPHVQAVQPLIGLYLIWSSS